MPIPTDIATLSPDPGANSPGGGEASNLVDNYLRQLMAFVAQLRDSSATSAAEIASTAPGKGAALVGVEDAASLFAGTTVEAALLELAEGRRYVDPHDAAYGAVGDGVADDAAAINAALTAAATSGRVVALKGGKTYRCAAPITMTVQGVALVGPGPESCTLLIDHTTGPGVSISAPYCRLEGVQVFASNTRRLYTTGSTYALAAGLHGVRMYVASGYLTSLRLNEVWSVGHPSHGYYLGGEAASSVFSQCAAYSNRGHGLLADDRTEMGGTSSRCGIVTIEQFRAVDNGGNAINADCPNGPNYRFSINNLETLWNAWNTSISGLPNAELALGGENHDITTPAMYDADGDARTATLHGYPRLPKTVLSNGLYIGSNSGPIAVWEPRFLSVGNGIVTAGTGSGLALTVGGGTYFTQQALAGGAVNQGAAVVLGSGYLSADLDITPTSAVNYLVISPTAGGRVRSGVKSGTIVGNNSGVIFWDVAPYQSATIASNSVNAQSARITLQTGAAAALVAIVCAGAGNPLPAGKVLHCFNGSAYAITLKHGTSAGYIRTKSGTDVVVPAGGRCSFVVDASGNPWEI